MSDNKRSEADRMLDETRARAQKALVALDACAAFGIELPAERCPRQVGEARRDWHVAIRKTNPHVGPSPKHGEA